MKKNKSLKTIFTNIFTISFFLVSFVLVINLADIFSSLITVGGFSFAGENLSFQKMITYAVCTSNHPTKLAASELSETTKIQGGAGYIYMNENSYYIIASIYDNSADAEKVLKNILSDKPNASIQQINIPAINIASNLSSQEKNTISDSIVVFKNSYKKLYDISVSLDTGLITEVNARLSINELASQITTIYGNFNTIFNNSLNTELMLIKLKLEDLINILQKLIDNTERFPFTSQIKETYCKILINYKSLAESIKS